MLFLSSYLSSYRQVAVRVRPSFENGERCIEVISPTSLLFDDGGRGKARKYSYDYVFKESDTQVRSCQRFIKCGIITLRDKNTFFS